MQLSHITATFFTLWIALVSCRDEDNGSIQYRAYNRNRGSDQDNGRTVQEKVYDLGEAEERHSFDFDKFKRSIVPAGVILGINEPGSKARCSIKPLNSTDMPRSYNDKSSGFFVDMGMILTDYYGLTSQISKLQMKSIARSFVDPVHSYAKAQRHQPNDVLYKSVVGLLNILIERTVNDTYISPVEWSKYGINRRVFSPLQVNDLLRSRSRLLKLAQNRDNGSDEVIRKEVTVRKLQLKMIQAKGMDTMNSIIATKKINFRHYRKRFASYMWNICAHTDDRETIRQVRNHFAYWLSQGSEDAESKSELDSIYKDGTSSSFFYPEGMKLSIATGIYTLIGAALIGLFLSA